MNTAAHNLRENGNVAVVSDYYRLKGKVEFFDNGKYFDLATAKTKDYQVKQAMVITAVEVFDLENLAIIKL